jgi:hypothetical protein
MSAVREYRTCLVTRRAGSTLAYAVPCSTRKARKPLRTDMAPKRPQTAGAAPRQKGAPRLYCAGVNVGPTILTGRLPGLAGAAADGVSDAESAGATRGMLPAGFRVS